ncbi:glycosyltransferase [Dankookia sp. P2]|uniref:glycosyltransferase n=1 Tax=Dankookia sp. P2 TaxID=3423955 RepID=UPI003D67AAA3
MDAARRSRRGRRLSPLLAFTAGRLWDEGKAAMTLDAAAARLPFPLLAAGPIAGPNGARVELRHMQSIGRLSTSEIAAILATRPVFVSAARYEPFGLAVLEAAQAGCALVLSDTTGFRELWDGAAVFVAPDDAAGFAATVESLADDAAGAPRSAFRHGSGPLASAWTGRSRECSLSMNR